MFSNHTGQAALEYLIVAAIIVAVVGATLLATAAAISDKLQQINADIGS